MQLRTRRPNAPRSTLRRRLAFTAVVAFSALFSLEASSQQNVQNVEQFGNHWMPIDGSGTWCGAKALWLIAEAEGFSFTVDDMKSMLGGNDSSDGTVSLASLCAALESLGFAAVAVQCKLELLQQHEGISFTVHNVFSAWEERMALHCMVFLGYEDGYYSVVDPFRPSRIQVMSEDDFRDSWTTHAVLIAREGAELPERRTWTRLLMTCLLVQILVAFGFLLRRHGLFRMLGCSAVILLSLIGCHDSSNSGEMLESGVLEFEYYAHDAGPLLLARHGESQAILIHPFTFVNRGDRPIQVKEGRTNCSCFVLRYPDVPVQPGEEGTIYVQADVSALAGPVTVNALLTVATPAQEWVKLELRCFVVRPPFTRRGPIGFRNRGSRCPGTESD